MHGSVWLSHSTCALFMAACVSSRTDSNPNVDLSKRLVDLTLDERLEYCEWVRVTPNLRPDEGCGAPDLEPFDPSELPECAQGLVDRLPDTCSFTVGDQVRCRHTPVLPPCDALPQECDLPDDCLCDGEICPRDI